MNFPRVSRYASETKSFLRSVWHRRRTSPQKRSIAVRCKRGDVGPFNQGGFYSEGNKIPTECGTFTYLKLHEIHQLGNFWFQDLHRLFIDLHSIGLLIALHLRQNGTIQVAERWRPCRWSRKLQPPLKKPSLYTIVTCGIAREQLLHVYSMIAYSCPSSNISF